MFNTRKCCQPAGRIGIDDVKAQVSGAATHARGFIVPLALDAKDRLVPLALDAKDRIVPLAEAAADRARPLAEAAVEFARPVVEQARLKMVDVVDTDVRPRLAELRLQATPVLAEVASRAHRAPVAVKAQPLAPAVPPKRRHPVLKWVGLAVLAAAIWLVVKTLLGSRDDGWELQEDDLDEDTDEIDVPADEQAAVAAEAPVEYGEGSYRGAEPPEGFEIKGNERSMKYHVPTAIGFERLVTDLWFDSPEAAERAGFTRALR